MIECRGRVDLDRSAWDRRWFKASKHDFIRVIGTQVLADGRPKVSRTFKSTSGLGR
jgi:hypothetical protein